MSDRRDEILDIAVTVAREAGELLSGYYGKLRRVDADRKDGRRRDLVSTADREAEALLCARVPASDDILAEEGSGRDNGADHCWVIDPLDGTVNFLHGIPFWAVSIGIVSAGTVSAAVVHAPALGETFTACRGGGCRLNDVPVSVSTTEDIGESILASGFAYNRNETADNNLDNWSTMAMAAGGLRRMGSASLDLAYTACGRFDGFWELQLAPWDVAAGVLLVREAGGRVTDFRGVEEVEAILHGRQLVASNGLVHDAIRQRLAPLRTL